MLSPRKQLFHQQSVQPGKAFLIRQFWAGKEGSTSTPPNTTNVRDPKAGKYNINIIS